MPDHFHWIMQIPEDCPNFSIPMHSIKRNYTINYRKSLGIKTQVQLWQPRFWDHVIRDEDDMQRHFDYIHWNPVKHGYTPNPESWEASSFQFWVQQGCYPAQWGCDGEPAVIRHLMANDL